MSNQKDSERQRIHKMNELLSHLPPEQREQITQRLSRSAPGLIRSKGSPSSKGSIDTPMRRAKSLARSILKRDRAVKQTKDRWSTQTSTQTQNSVEGEPLSWEEEDLKISIKKLPVNALLTLQVNCLLKAYLASDIEDWLKALKIAEPEVKEHLLFTLPVRYASELEDELRSLGPIKLSDAQEAATRVMAQVQRLGERGDIELSRFAEKT